MIKNFLYVLLLILILSCAAKREIVIAEAEDCQKDSIEYEIIIMESGFESWFATHRKPVWFYCEEFYHNWNNIYSREWNYRVTAFNYGEPYDYLINFEQEKKYGVEIEHKLYWWFKFMESKHNMFLHISSRN